MNFDFKSTFNSFFKEWTDEDSANAQQEAQQRITTAEPLLARLEQDITDAEAWESLVAIGYATKMSNGSRGGNYRETNQEEEDRSMVRRQVEAITREMNNGMNR